MGMKPAASEWYTLNLDEKFNCQRLKHAKCSIVNTDKVYTCSNIGIKHFFLCINICWALSLKGEGFNDPPRGPADVSVSENHV